MKSAMKRVAPTPSGATLSFVTADLERYAAALGVLVEIRDGSPAMLTDEQVEALADLHAKIRLAVLLTTNGDCLSPATKRHLTQAGIE